MIKMSFVDSTIHTYELCNYSLAVMPDFSEYDNLTELNMSHNSFCTIDPVKLPPYLMKLILIKNNLNSTINHKVILSTITMLCLDENLIDVFDGRELRNLKQLSIKNNDLREFIFPPNISMLYISGNKITNLDDFPASLRAIDCSHNQLSQLPKINIGLTELLCNLNIIEELPDLPDSIMALDASDNLLRTIEQLPANLEDLTLNGNSLSDISCSLPKFLKELYLDDNQFTYLPPMPSYIEIICIKNNKITKLHSQEIPFNVNHLNISNNKLSEIPLILKNRIKEFIFSGNREDSVQPLGNPCVQPLGNPCGQPLGNPLDIVNTKGTTFDDYYHADTANETSYDESSPHTRKRSNSYSWDSDYLFNDTKTTTYEKYNFVNVNLKNPCCVSVWSTGKIII